MITINEYVGPHRNSPDWTPERQANALVLLDACWQLEQEALKDGMVFPVNPTTGSGVSGKTFGGFRPQNCPQGASNSSHKEGQAVDRYDPQGELCAWAMANLEKLEDHGLYMEHPSATQSWWHLTTRRPGSGNRVFYP